MLGWLQEWVCANQCGFKHKEYDMVVAHEETCGKEARRWDDTGCWQLGGQGTRSTWCAMCWVGGSHRRAMVILLCAGDCGGGW